MDFGSEVEDDKGYLDELKGEDEEKKEDDLNEGSELEEEKDFEDDQIKSGEFEGDLDQELPEEKEESIWDDIDWSEDMHGEGEKTIWDEIDWSEDKRGEREETIWDEIDWSEDKHGEGHKNEEGKNEDQNEGYVENVESQSTSTVLSNKIEEIESNVEHQEQEEEIEIRSEEYRDDTEPIVNTDESEFIKGVDELAEYARETKAEDESVEPQAEQENASYYAEQYYETLKEKEVLNDQDSKEGQETEELKQEVTEELKVDQESDYNSDKLEEEDIIEASEEIISTEEFEYLWEVRDKLDQEGKTSEEIEDVMHEAEQMYETLRNAEKIYEELQQEKLKLVDHEDEATEEDLKEDLDRVDLIEQAVELEEELVQQGKYQEEIDARVEESIEETLETAKFEEGLEKIIEKERKELKVHEDEESVEKEDLDRVDLIEQAVELEEKLVQQGESQEEIDAGVEESIDETLETAKFEEGLEKTIEKERKELKNREDEEYVGVTREYIDRPAEAEYYIEEEEELHRQGMSQEEIDEQMEEIANSYQNEINKKQENEQATNVSEELEKQVLEIKEQNSSAEQCDQIELSALSSEKEVETYENVENKENLEALKPELNAIKSESEDKKDLLEEITELKTEESVEEESEHLQELYRQETGRRPIYARKKTNGYSQWLEQRELIKNSKSESEKIKEIKEEDWKTTLKQWIGEASEEECNAELKSELKKVLESYNEFENLTRKFLELYEKAQYEKLSEKEKNILKSLTKRLKKLDPIKLELSTSVFFIKKYITEQYWSDFWNRPLVNRVLSKFFKHISQKYKKLRIIESEEKNEKETEIQNEDEFKAIIEKYKYTGSWKIVSEDYVHYSRDSLYRMVRITLGEEEYNELVKNYSNQKNAFKQTEKVIIPNNILNEIIRIFKSNEFKGWREMSNRYPEYSEKVIWSRVKENLGDDTYHSIIEKKSTKIAISEELLNEMIEKYKIFGSWNKVSELYSEYKMDTIASRVKYFIGQIEYDNLKQNYSGNKDISLEKIIVPKDTLRDMIEIFKQLHSWVKVSNQYPGYPTNIIRNRVKEYLGGNSYRNLVKNHRKGLITRSREIFIPIETLRSKIEDYKQKGIWEKVMTDKDQYSLRSLIRQIKEMIGIENYQSLIDQYSIKDNSNLMPNKKIVIPLPILNLMIIEYKKLHSWTKVSDKFPDYSTGITSERVKEYIGPEEYEKLIQQYSKKIIPSRKISISESFLKEIIMEYDKHQSWAKVAESYTFSRPFISLRVKEYLGEEGYNELIKREINETQYTKLFYNEEYRVQNAFAQIVQIVDNTIVKPQLDKSFENWEDVMIFLNENPSYKFVDMLTGEIIEEKCLIDFHHIDGDKSNDALINLAYLLHENHTIISIAQNNWKLLRVFFEELITSNIKSLSKGLIPKSWILGWRSLAIEGGIDLPEKSYRRHGLIFRTITGKESNVLKLVNFTEGKSTNGKVAIIDIEHTGGNPHEGKIIEIGITELDLKSGNISPIFDSLIREKGFLLKEHSKNYFMNNVNKISPKLIISLGKKFGLEYNKQILQKILKSYEHIYYWDCTNHTEYEWLKTKGFDVSNFHDFQFFVKSYLKAKNIRKFNFQYVWNYFLNEHSRNASKYLRETEYYQNHRAYDDAEHEALLLYYLVKEKQFKLK